MHTYTVSITSGSVDDPVMTNLTFVSQRLATQVFVSLLSDELLKNSSDLICIELTDDSMGIVIGQFNV